MVVDSVGPIGSVRARNNLHTLRAFRDELLARSDRGRELVGAYVSFSPRVLLLFIQHPSLRKEAARVIEEITPIARAMLRASDAGDSKPVITAQSVDMVTRFAKSLADADRKYRGGGSLAKTIRARLAEINPKSLIGLSAREARRVLRL
jgi:hypothetical protein